MLHSKLYPPSGADRWMACPGSVELCKEAVEKPASFYAEEGTLAHAVAEGIVKGLWNEEMIKHGLSYKAVIQEKMIETGLSLDDVHLENVVQINCTDKEQGTIDCWFYDPRTRILYVVDYKYGRHKKVSPLFNKQLMLYALGVIDTHELYPLKIELTIVQPRCVSPLDKWANEVSSSWTCTILEVRQFEQEVKDTKGLSFLTKGAHCWWCPAYSICPLHQAVIDPNMFETNNGEDL